jgi:hypothetical protein
MLEARDLGKDPPARFENAEQFVRLILLDVRPLQLAELLQLAITRQLGDECIDDGADI